MAKVAILEKKRTKGNLRMLGRESWTIFHSAAFRRTVLRSILVPLLLSVWAKHRIDSSASERGKVRPTVRPAYLPIKARLLWMWGYLWVTYSTAIGQPSRCISHHRRAKFVTCPASTSSILPWTIQCPLNQANLDFDWNHRVLKLIFSQCGFPATG